MAQPYKRRTPKAKIENKNSFLNQTITSIIILIFVLIISLSQPNNKDNLKNKLNNMITRNSIKTDVENTTKYVASIFNNLSEIKQPAPKENQDQDQVQVQNSDRVDFEVLEKLNKKEESYEVK